MTTDITELAQSLKAAADREMIYRDGAETSEIWERTVTPENILALVEALEYYKSREERVTSLVRDNSKSWDELYRQVEAKGKRNVELVEALESEKRICATWRKTAESTSEKLEKAQAAERRWHRVASRVHEQACESDVKIDELEAIRAAAEKLVRCKGRYHSEQNYRALAALFGVKTPDLPPLEHENVHYADAAEMEIAALRQRIAKLESRTVKLPKPHAHLIWIQAGHAPDDYWDDVAVSHSEKDRCCDGSERYPVYARWEIEEMMSAAGIKVEAE
ncbi:ead/Ea22-like family protein [Klebsiella quasipneumoniae]|uniref:RelE family toxin-antitoxin system n=1 Tax=Klebsiella quasipneumoniae TaxID=1463165 RepID=A0ABD7N263_9ENTR|nr:ead/Ea22-like family protein [Klebsiella quasipneumoniae]SSF78368.1 RelE family toxin-antitoxin system [Klebsiella quasipneumoniae]SSG60459.1 RelE family toxin-antitoxin system [Klebsiella quasipneumoniae]